ncbi:hypothetical protein F4809DRAFT_604355 [Biscogniauxia mediterranea]|nr:hypothetical protein F4809DRAFT_604355 [Biscogniauxia mediterranea]
MHTYDVGRGFLLMANQVILVFLSPLLTTTNFEEKKRKILIFWCGDLLTVLRYKEEGEGLRLDGVYGCLIALNFTIYYYYCCYYLSMYRFTGV